MATESSKQRDPLFVVVLLGICCVSVWLLLMPFYPAIARITLERFHLQTESFGKWAIQAPVPAMYNFANQYEIRDIPEDLITPVVDSTRPRFINHFPTRILTFANSRYVLLKAGQDRWLVFRSSYRGQTLETKVHARPAGDGVFEWVRQSSEYLSPEELEPADPLDFLLSTQEQR
ncbi:MAG: hypothetical protein AAFV88_01215 [Planctomycetota bacterium]